jgi:protein-arginine kinase activator protein McsA
MSEIEKLENYSLQDLKSFLQEAIEREDYENASLIRDEIARKSKSE